VKGQGKISRFAEKIFEKSFFLSTFQPNEAEN
jgi:hypothetical protein